MKWLAITMLICAAISHYCPAKIALGLPTTYCTGDR